MGDNRSNSSETADQAHTRDQVVDAQGICKDLCVFDCSCQSPSRRDGRACGCPWKQGGMLTSPMGTASIACSYCTAPSRPCSWKIWSVSLEKSTASPSNTTRSGVPGACTSCWKTSAAETPVRQSKWGYKGHPSLGQLIHGQLLPTHLLQPCPTLPCQGLQARSFLGESGQPFHGCVIP